MGVASLVLGIVSLIVGFVPLCGAIALLPAIVGLILGIIDTVKKGKTNEKKGQSIAGIVMCAIAIVIIIFWVFVASVGSDTNTTTLTPGNSKETSNAVEQNNETISTKVKYNVGEIYKDNTIAIKYVSLDENFTSYSRYADVKEGCKVIKAEFEFENLSSSDQYVSSFEFDCFADGYDCESFYYTDDSSFGSTLSSGKKAKGAVYFQVPKNAEEITLEYSLNYWTSSRIEFVVK